ncbi:MAG: phosphotransferase family protein [Acidimicrobiales bacterium]|nr:phosphotransferase family protein [Acidimicrobiales bacterium]
MSDANVPEGIDPAGVTAWLTERAEVVTPLRFELITGGHSNLTFRVIDAAGTRWVLRRPPLHLVLATAHDMGREHRILSALGPTDVPVPPVVGLCTDEAVNGAPFYVMDFVDGRVVRDTHVALEMTLEQRHAAGDSLVEVLTRIHAVDVDAVGLGDLGKKEDYIARQLKRWYGQFEKSKTRELPVIDEVHQALQELTPPQQRSTIVHGDYRLDNCLLGADGRLAAVLDWEICTLGDPLADVGLLMVYWADPDEGGMQGIPSPTGVEGFPTRAELLARYAELSDLDLSGIDFYVAFGYWKLACIIEGVYARYVGGAMGDRGNPGEFDFFGDQVVAIAERAREAVERLR